MTSLITTGQVGTLGWIALAWLFLMLGVGIPLIRKARARGKRLFVDKPNEVLSHLKYDTTHVHDYDGFQ